MKNNYIQKKIDPNIIENTHVNVSAVTIPALTAHAHTLPPVNGMNWTRND